MSGAAWRVWIDTGGTFTDCLAVDPDGGLHRAKVLSSSAVRLAVAAVEDPRTVRVSPPTPLPAGVLEGGQLQRLGAGSGVGVLRHEGPPHRLRLEAALEPPPTPGEVVEVRLDEPAPVLAARVATATPRARPLPPMELRLGTTLATNALLERRGARVVLVITRGFGDLLRIGDQRRPELFALDIRRPEPLHAAVVEIPGRLAADGSGLEPHDLEPVASELERFAAEGFEAAAVVLLHGYLRPEIASSLGAGLREFGFRYVAVGAELAPEIRILPRAATAVADAYVGPVVTDYLERVRSGSRADRLLVMTSAGGLADAAEVAPKDTLLSGPAAGVVGAAAAARAEGLDRAITFDMGGTSTDVARWDGDLEYRFEHTVGPATLLAPAVAIETVAAGGGSLCRFDGHRLRVGPESAGADPGPACYGAGGPLALTDVNLLLGRLVPERFGIPLRPDAARTALEGILASLEAAGQAAAAEQVLAGFLEIANERMAEAIRRISVHRGADPAAYALVAFGGAGAQHACAVAALLGIATVVVPADAGLLSALGLGAAVLERFAHREVLRPLDEVAPEVPRWLGELSARAARAVVGEGVAPDRVAIRRRIASLRLAGQEATLEVEAGEGTGLRERFLEAFAARFGYTPPRPRIELVSLRAVASAPPAPAPAVRGASPARPSGPRRTQRAWFTGGWREVPVADREELAAGERIEGPALIAEAHSVTVVEPGWTAAVGRGGGLVLGRRP